MLRAQNCVQPTAFESSPCPPAIIYHTHDPLPGYINPLVMTSSVISGCVH
jgi:hypothetical protein